MTTRAPAKIENPIVVSITVAGTAYNFLAAPNVARIQINDRPQAFRTSQAEAFQGQYRDPLSLGGITNAFGARAIGPWDPRGSIADHLAHGHVHVLHDSEAETRFGYMTLPRQKNTLTFPATAMASPTSDSIFGGVADTDTAVSRHSYNDRPSLYYSGSAVAGVRVWEAHGKSAAASQVEAYAWTGAGFSASVAVFAAAGATDESRVFDQVVHKGVLLLAGTNKRGTAANNQIYSSTTGNTYADAGTQPVAEAFLEGTRFIDDGNNLWLIMQVTSNVIRVTKSTDGASTWAATAVWGQGQVRSVGKYFNRSATPVLVVLTEDALYEMDETNNVLKSLWQLPFRGRGMIEFDGSLYVFMDAMHVYSYTQGEGKTIIDEVSPGGGEAMPSGKDFREDTDGAVVLTATARGFYAAWSGDGPTSSTLNRALCLFYDGKGWHFIWRAANTTGDAGYSARALALDPVSGDLLYFGATVSSGDEARTHDSVRIIKAETDVRLLSANIFETAGLVETPLITPPPSEVTTTFLDIFYNSENVATGVTLQTKFGTDGVAATTNTLEANGAPDAATVAIDLAKRYFPSDATAAGTAAGTEGVGSNFNTIRYRHTFAGTAAVGPLLYNSIIGYAKIPDAKDLIIVDAIVDPSVVDIAIPASETVWTNVATVKNSKLKVTLNYSKVVGDILAMPIPETRMQQLIPATEILPARRSGTVRFVFAQV